jgi:tetratricopeptide (TPR) repeat protein
MRDFRTILAQANLSDLRPTGGRPVAVEELAPWADEVSSKKQFPEMLWALGALRLAKQFDKANQYAQANDASIPAEWRNTWENEKAALLWHQGRCDEARATWDALEATIPVLFNRGMAALFANDKTVAKQHLTAAVAKLPVSGAWHHLGRLYLTLVDLAR